MIPGGSKSSKSPKEFQNIHDHTGIEKEKIIKHILNSGKVYINSFLEILVESETITQEQKKTMVDRLWQSDESSSLKVLAQMLKKYDSIVSGDIQIDFQTLASNQSTLLKELANKKSRYFIMLKTIFKSQSGEISPELEKKLSLKKISEILREVLVKIN